MDELFFITSNRNKFLEINNMFRTSLKHVKLKRADIKKIEIQSKNLEEIVRYAAEWILENTDFRKPFFIEDAGLFIDILNGFPGPYSHYVYETIGIDGVLRLLGDIEKRDAKFLSVIAFWDGHKVVTFIGEVTGKIARCPRGSHGFGFDPIFIPNESDKTFAEMDLNEKNLYSHRSKAAKKMIDYISKILLPTKSTNSTC